MSQLSTCWHWLDPRPSVRGVTGPAAEGAQGGTPEIIGRSEDVFNSSITGAPAGLPVLIK